MVDAMMSSEAGKVGRLLSRLVEERRSDFVDAGVDDLRFPRSHVDREVDRTIAALANLETILPWIEHREPRAPLPRRIAILLPYNFVSHAIAVIAPIAIAGNAIEVRFSSKSRSVAELSMTILKHVFGSQIAKNEAQSWQFVDQVLDGPSAYPMLIAYGGENLGSSLITYEGRTRIVFEGPGNDPLIASAEPAIEDLATLVLQCALSQSGQECFSTERLIICREDYDEVIEALKEAFQQVRFGHPSDPETEVGPLASAALPEIIRAQIEEAQHNGGRVLCGGSVYSDRVEPTLIENVPPESSVWRDETFGPVVAVRKAETLHAAVREASTSRYGLNVILSGAAAQAIGPLLVGSRYVSRVDTLRHGLHGTLTEDQPPLSTWRDTYKPLGGWGISGWIREADGTMYQGPRVLAYESTLEAKE